MFGVQLVNRWCVCSCRWQKVVFDIPVFHPLVDPVSGELDVRRAFTKWR